MALQYCIHRILIFLSFKLLLRSLLCLFSCILMYTLLSFNLQQISTSSIEFESWTIGQEETQCSPVPSHLPVKLPHSQRVVLVTGAAGFIGYHVSRTLVEDWRATVVGLDLFTDYYDTQLKYDRADELIEIGVPVYRGDVCDAQLLLHLFEQYQFTDVVHMAAQAGVRHSLKDPVSYVHNNIGCFEVLLESLKHFKDISLVYASSSSVYGKTAPLPFSTLRPPNPPANIYAASKQVNELFSKTYCSEFGVVSIGVRPFTVYGPWGRPDMAVYKFTDSIATGRPIPLFTASQVLQRDFTYVGDVVGVLLAALDRTPECCGEVYNAGRGERQNLSTLVDLLQEILNIEASINPSPLLSCDLHVTWADTNETTRVLGYTPQVGLREGVQKFLDWYQDYHSDRDSRKSSKQQREKYREKEVEAVAKKHVETRNEIFQSRLSGLREKYYHYARDNMIPLPNLAKNRFIFYPGKESEGHTIIKAPGYKNDVKLLEERCRATEQCIAFTSQGEFKNRLTDVSYWVSSKPGEGMYVADIDLCSADLHFCGKHSKCVYAGPAQYECVCDSGYVQVGQSCVERYVPGVVGETEKEWILSDQFDGINWKETIQGKSFVFFQGLLSAGGDYLVARGYSAEELKQACLNTHHCVGFTTNGILKHSLESPKMWNKYPSKHGFYVLDVNYCSFSMEQCPPHSKCLRQSPGKYSCACAPPWTSSSSYGQDCISDPIHIILSTDSEQLPGLVGVINSTLSHAKNPSGILFHVVFIGQQRVIESFLSCYGYRDHPQIEITMFKASMIKEPIKVYSKESQVGNLASPGNFARFYFHTLFPNLSHAVYLDVDTLVLGDVAEVWKQLRSTKTLLVAAPRILSITYENFFSENVKLMFKKRYKKEFGSADVTFNAGVYGVNFKLWRQKNIHEEVAYWMKQQASAPLWNCGTQPIMLLVVYGQWEHLDFHWNIDGLGWNNNIKRSILNQAKLLHWNGKGKPWLPNGLHKDLWQAHGPTACSGHGQCVTAETGTYTCQCDSGRTGEHCVFHESVIQTI